MGWKVGDRIVIAPTDFGSAGNAADFTIHSFDSNNVNSINLGNRNGLGIDLLSSTFESKSKYTGKNMTALMQAEIINLSRNIIITGMLNLIVHSFSIIILLIKGDDFEHVDCVNDGPGQPSDLQQGDHCSCWSSIKRTKCTLGLHTVSMGVGSVLSLKYARVEKCGQRGVLGKYCIHFHLNQKCKDCQAIGNAVLYLYQINLIQKLLTFLLG